MRMLMRSAVLGVVAAVAVGAVYMLSGSAQSGRSSVPSPCVSNDCPTQEQSPATVPFDLPNVGRVQTGALPCVITHVDRRGNIVADAEGVPLLYLNPLCRKANVSGPNDYPPGDSGAYSP